MSFSLDDEADKDIIDYLNSLKNKSAYIAEVLRADIKKKGTFTDAQREEIRAIIREFISEGNIIAADRDDGKKENFDKDAMEALGAFNDM